jgi:hypothetical protein
MALQVDIGRATTARPKGNTQGNRTILSNVRANLVTPKDGQILELIALGLPGLSQATAQLLWKFMVGGYDENPTPAGWQVLLHDIVIFTGNDSNTEMTGRYEVISDGRFSPLLPANASWVLRRGN